LPEHDALTAIRMLRIIVGLTRIIVGHFRM